MLMHAPAINSRQSEVALLRYWPILVKRKWVLVLTIALALLAGWTLALLTTPKYRATAMLQFERQPTRTISVKGVAPIEDPGDGTFYETQLQLLLSRNMAERVVARLDPEDPIFETMNARSFWQRTIGVILAEDQPRALDKNPQARHQQLVDLVRAGLVIEPVVDSLTSEKMRWHNLWGVERSRYVVLPLVPSLLVRLHFDSPDPVLSAKVANAVADEALISHAERRNEANAFAKAFLADRIDLLRLALLESERALSDHAQSEGVVDVDDHRSLSTGDLASLAKSLAEARRLRIDAEVALLESRRGAAYSHPLMFNDQNIAAVRAVRGKLEAEYQEKLLTYRPDYPLMLQLKNRIKQVDEQLAIEINAFKSNLAANMRQAVEKEVMLEEEVDSVSQRVLALQSRRGEFTVLESDVAADRKLYATLLKRYQEIDATANTESRNISLVDSAVTPLSPFEPDTQAYLGWAALVGLILGVGTIATLEFIDATLQRPDQIERHLGLSALGVVPKLGRLSPDDARRDPRSAFSEAYRSARTSLEFSTSQGAPRSLLITSSSASEGKSTSALTLARDFAQLGRRVLLIDADLRRPALHRMLQSDNSIGLSNYLCGDMKPASAIRPTDTLRLIFMPAGPVPPNPAELLAGSKMAELIKLVSQKFDHVIIDGPPILGLADAVILSSLSSGTLMIVEAETVRIAAAKNALKRVLSVRASVVGALLTKFDSRVSIYGDESGEYYHYGYGVAPGVAPQAAVRKPFKPSSNIARKRALVSPRVPARVAGSRQDGPHAGRREQKA